MGGQAFAHLSPPLFTPRMPQTIYDQILARTHALLRRHYRLVGSPIEGPGKDTYGDIDVLVLDPNPDSPLHGITFRPQLAVQLSEYLGAKHYVLGKGNLSFNFAIPWPSQNEQDAGEEQEIEKFVQLDIEICESEKMYRWELFHAAHGDLWSILGSTIRRFGLTVNNLGMYLRILEVEPLNRKRSMVYLTDDHAQILRFLGLDPE